MRKLFVVFIFVLTLSVLGFGQTRMTQVHITSDALQKCGPVPNWDITAMNAYYPKFKSAARTYGNIQTYQKVTLACMQTSLPQYKANNGYGYVVMPAGSQYGFTANGQAYYLGTPDGQALRCHNHTLGIWQLEIVEETWVSPTPTPTPVATPVPVAKCPNVDLTIEQAKKVGMIITDQGLCVMPKPVAEKEDCPECPDDVDASVEASMKTKLVGGLTGTAISAGAGCVVSGILNKNLKDCLIDGAISAGTNRVVQIVNPSPDTVKFTANGETKKFRRGKSGEVGECEVSWKGNTAILTCGDQECMRVPLPRNLNTTVFAIKRGQKTPIKTQTPGQIPIRTGVATNNGGQIPGGGVPVIPGNGIPTRPRRDFVPTTGGGNNTANTNNNSTSNTTTNNGAVTEAAQPGYRWATLGDGRKIQVPIN